VIIAAAFSAGVSAAAAPPAAAVTRASVTTARAAVRAPGRPAAHGPATTGAVASPSLQPHVAQVCKWPPPSGQAACLVLRRTDITDHLGLFAAGSAPAGYGPADLRSAYNLPSASGGQGQTVALVDAYDDPNAESDLAVYRSQYGLPPCTTANGCFRKVNQAGQQGNYPPPDPDWAVEESLDIQMVSAICPNCHILLVEASPSFSGLAQGVDTAVSLGASYVSNSYGAPVGDIPSLDKYYDHPGVAVTVASGDSGYGVEWPATSPQVVSVGGTSLLPASNPRGWDEVVWTGTGSGCTTLPKPTWQADTGCSHRTDNDVAAVADPETGVAIYDSYGYFGWPPGWGEVGGTSVASPIIASVYALAGRPAPGTYPASYLYRAQGDDEAGLFDIVAGTNKLTGPDCNPPYLCHGEPGYDGPTGVGSPDGAGAFALPTDYVAMGDSYSSGEGNPPWYPGTNTKQDQCHRSLNAYPTMVTLPGDSVPIAKLGGNEKFAFIACSGALTTGITKAAVGYQNADEEQWNAKGYTLWGTAQTGPEYPEVNNSALNASTTLVTLTVGGNDSRFSAVLTGCLVLAKLQLKTCLSPKYRLKQTKQPGKPVDPDALTVFEPKVIDLLPWHLEKTYEAIHAEAPHAEIVVAGYPLLFPQNATATCSVGLKFSLSAAIQNWLNSMGTQLNQAVSTAVAEVRGTGVDIRYVDPTSAFTGHAVCSPQPWIYGLIGKLPISSLSFVSPGSFHPNQAGQNAYAKLINGCLAGSVPC
jgi:hypothetical protein